MPWRVLSLQATTLATWPNWQIYNTSPGISGCDLYTKEVGSQKSQLHQHHNTGPGLGEQALTFEWLGEGRWRRRITGFYMRLDLFQYVQLNFFLLIKFKTQHKLTNHNSDFKNYVPMHTSSNCETGFMMCSHLVGSEGKRTCLESDRTSWSWGCHSGPRRDKSNLSLPVFSK